MEWLRSPVFPTYLTLTIFVGKHLRISLCKFVANMLDFLAILELRFLIFVGPMLCSDMKALPAEN